MKAFVPKHYEGDDADPLLLAVLLDPKRKSLTLQEYLDQLAVRIGDLAEATPGASELARQLDLTNGELPSPDQLGLTLIELHRSRILRDVDRDQFPVDLAKIPHNSLGAELIEETSLDEWLQELVPSEHLT